PEARRAVPDGTRRLQALSCVSISARLPSAVPRLPRAARERDGATTITDTQSVIRPLYMKTGARGLRPTVHPCADARQRLRGDLLTTPAIRGGDSRANQQQRRRFGNRGLPSRLISEDLELDARI